MKLLEYFDSFLADTVNLNPSRLDLLDARAEAVTNFLRDCDTFSPYFVDVVAQGSYAHRTIIKPAKANKEFDADLLLHMEEIADWQAKDYVESLYAAFRQSPTYKEKVRRKSRCVMVDYAGDFHIDVVPYMERHEEHYITNRNEGDEGGFELTNPEGFNEWLDGKDRITGRRLVKVIRLVKFLRDFKQTFSVKSFVLSTLLGNVVSDAALEESPGCYADIPTTLKSVMGRLNDYLEDNPDMPVIEDPAGTGEDLSQRWDQEKYSNFRDKIEFYSGKIADAYDEADKDKSLAKWQEVFGTAFKAPAQNKQAAVTESAPSTERFLEDLHIGEQLDSAYRFELRATAMDKPGFRRAELGLLGNRVHRNRKVRFEVVRCNVPGPYRVFWKVRNTGEEAARANCLRGEIVEDQGGGSKEEPTKYRGRHYVECYIVKDGICVAKRKQPVIIVG